MLNDLWIRLRALFRRKAVEAELDEELRFHLDQQTEKCIQSGMTPEEAARQARIDLGGVEQTKEEHRDARGIRFLEDTWRDVCYGARMLRKSPGFTIVAILTLALGIGANTAIFSVVYGILFRPLPYANSAGLVGVWSATNEQPEELDSLADYLQVKAAGHVFGSVAGEHWRVATLTGQGPPATVWVGRVSSDFFSTFGASALYGRTFAPGERQPGHSSAAVLSFALWRKNFSGDPSIVGKRILLDERPYTVIGVMPPWFRPQAGELDLWTPSDQRDDLQATPNEHLMSIFATLQRGVSLEQAQAALAVISKRVASESAFERGRGFRLYAEPAQQFGVGRVRRGLFILLGAAGFVLLMACTNIASLLLSRGSARQTELALRAALGATRTRIIRQMLAECGLLAIAGGACGFLLSIWGTGLLTSLAPADTPRIDRVGLNVAVLLFAAGVSVLAGTLAGLAPALKFSKRRGTALLRNDQQEILGVSGTRRLGLRELLVIFEIALCFVLMIGALLTIRSLRNLLDVNFGFPTDQVLSLRIGFPRFEYKNFQQESAAVSQILQRIDAVPGVAAASVRINPVLQTGVGLSGLIGVVGRPGPAPSHGFEVQVRYVTLAYFDTLRIPVIQGRAFEPQDDSSVVPVAVVDQAFVREYLSGKNPLTQHLIDYRCNRGPAIIREIVGVVPGVRDRDPDVPPSPTVYIPWSQNPVGSVGNAFFLVRSEIAPARLVKALEGQVWSVDEDLPIAEVITLNHEISNDVAEPRFRSTLLSAFGGLGVLIALIGIYGVMSFSVSQRTHEIGIRMALGAQPREVLRMVVRDGAALVGMGVALGTGGALTLTRFLRSFLFEIKPTDPATYAGVAIALALVALFACYIPARRAAKLDPMLVLRHE